MKKIKKKIVSFVLACVMLVGMGVSASAAELQEWTNLSPVPPIYQTGVSVYGLDRPSKDDYVDLNKEAMEFSGYAEGSVLYTNKCFTGKSTINYEFTNKSSSKLTVKFYSKGNILGLSFKSIVIEGNATLTGRISGLDADQFYYLSFSAPNNSSGKIW